MKHLKLEYLNSKDLSLDSLKFKIIYSNRIIIKFKLKSLEFNNFRLKINFVNPLNPKTIEKHLIFLL